MEEELKKDEGIRYEFGRIFDWEKPKKQYNYVEEKEYRTPTWAEIFVKVGRLMQIRDNVSLDERLKSLESIVRTEIQDFND